ncbi:MAG: ABC transporter permease [Planctomycetes bacterium]|nr:ABC transporter permease [Planctomycetota bacterium]
MREASKVLRIARREYKATVRTKGFIIGLILAPFLMGGSSIVFALLKDRVDTRDKRLAVVDRSGLVAEVLARAAEKHNAEDVHDPATGKKIRPAYFVEIVPPDGADPDAQRLRLSDRIRRGELHAFVDIGEGVLHPRRAAQGAGIAYYAKSPALDELRGWIAGPVNEELRRLRVKEAGIDPAAAEDLFDWIRADGLGLVSADPETGGIRPAERRREAEAILVPLILPVILFLMIMMGAAPLLQSVMEEKSERIAEVMLGAIKPFPFMIGKLLGGVSVSLTAATIYIAIGVATVQHLDLGRYVPYGTLPWFFAYMVVAIFLFGALFAALGSACSNASEAQAVTLPAILTVIAPMFVLMPVTMNPRSAFATGLSFIPLFTPTLMLVRQSTPEGIPMWQPWVGLAGTMLATVFFIWVGGRVFRVGILMQGTPPSLRNFVRWAIRG